MAVAATVTARLRDDDIIHVTACCTARDQHDPTFSITGDHIKYKVEPTTVSSAYKNLLVYILLSLLTAVFGPIYYGPP